MWTKSPFVYHATSPEGVDGVREVECQTLEEALAEARADLVGGESHPLGIYDRAGLVYDARAIRELLEGS
jgi:hypothetical protein